MTSQRLPYLRAVIVTGYLVLVILSVYNLAARRSIHLSLEVVDGRVTVVKVPQNSTAEQFGLQKGDVLLSVNDHPVENLFQAQWELASFHGEGPAILLLDRRGVHLPVRIPYESAYSFAFVLLNTILGISMLGIGLLIWFTASHGVVVRTFFWLSLLSGIAVLLVNQYNAFRLPLLHYGIGALWAVSLALLPATLLGFLHRFPEESEALKPMTRYLLFFFSPSVLLGGWLVWRLMAAYANPSPANIEAFSKVYNGPFSLFLIVFLLAGILRLLYVYLHPARTLDRNRIIWLLGTMTLALLPYILFFKLPILLGSRPLLPYWAAASLLLILPVGWGMVVASFRLMRLEWVLSRTMVYITTLILILYLLTTMTIIWMEYLSEHSVLALAGLIVTQVIVLFLAFLSLLGRIRWLIDRVYFRDWYDVRSTINELNRELSRARSLKDISSILSDKLAGVLKVERASAFLVDGSNNWLMLAPESTSAPQMDAEELDRILLNLETSNLLVQRSAFQKLAERSWDLGFRAAVRLTHNGQESGILLLGQKISGATYSERDQQLLQNLANNLMAAVLICRGNERRMEKERRSLNVDLSLGLSDDLRRIASPFQRATMQLRAALVDHPDRGFVERVRPPLGVVQSTCDRIQNLASDLHTFAQPPLPVRRLAALNTLVGDVLDRIERNPGNYFSSPEKSSSRIPFNMVRELSSDPIEVVLDRQQVSEAFIHLLTFAAGGLTHLNQGTIHIRTAKATPHGGTRLQAIVTIQEDGIGITPEEITWIWHPYFRFDDRNESTGLKLAKARSLLEANGGKVIAASAPRAGVKFECWFPLGSRVK